jgi:hypothetical protein
MWTLRLMLQAAVVQLCCIMPEQRATSTQLQALPGTCKAANRLLLASLHCMAPAR